MSESMEISVRSVADVEPLSTERTRRENVEVRVLADEGNGSTQSWLAHTVFPTGARHEVHRHPERDQIIYVVSGELVLTGAEGPMATLVSGDTVRAPAGSWHGLENHREESAVTLACFGGTGSGESAGYELLQPVEAQSDGE